MSNSSLSLALLPLSFAIFGTVNPVWAGGLAPPTTFRLAVIGAPQVAAIAEQVSVKIDGQAPGSGVLFAKQGQTYYILTAAHVVATPDEYDIVTPDGQKYRVNYAQVRKLAGLDLAIIPFTSSRNYSLAKLGDSSQIRRGMTTYVAGWPAIGTELTQNNLQFQPGLISANSQTQQDNGYGLVYNNNTLPGMSGGPVFNDQGEVIGIHGRGEAERLQATGSPDVAIKLGFNQGIPINTFLASAPKSGLNLGLRTVQPLPTAKTTATRSPDDLLAQGLNFLRSRNYQGALENFNQAIQQDPKDAKLYVNRSKARLSLRDSEGALADLNQALQLDPQDSNQAYLNRGNLYLTQGRLPAALADYNQALQRNPRNAEAYYQRAIVMERMGNRLQAQNDLTQAIGFNPRLAEAYSRRGALYAAQGDRMRAMTDFNRALLFDLFLASAYFNRAGLHAQMGNRPQAMSDYQRAAQYYLRDGNFSQHREAMRQLQLLR